MSASDILPVILRFAAISAAIYLLIAVGLVLSQGPSETLAGDTIRFADLSGPDDQTPAASLLSWQARDGATLGYRHYESGNSNAPLMVFLHGSGWHGGAYDGLARRIAASGAADVALPDLRGHGPKANPRGDIAYIGQFEDDIADLVSALRRPGQRLVLGGHSSGGGLVIRYAGGRHADMLDGAVLLAPYLKYNAPVMRPNSGGWARPLSRRIIGLSMLNAVGIKALNHLVAIQFHFPGEVLNGPLGSTATPSYSYRLNSAYAPRNDYLADIAALPAFLLIAGADDEAFIADAYEPLMKSVNPAGRYALIEGETHLGIIDNEATADLIRDYLRTLSSER